MRISLARIRSFEIGNPLIDRAIQHSALIKVLIPKLEEYQKARNPLLEFAERFLQAREELSFNALQILNSGNPPDTMFVERMKPVKERYVEELGRLYRNKIAKFLKSNNIKLANLKTLYNRGDIEYVNRTLLCVCRDLIRLKENGFKLPGKIIYTAPEFLSVTKRIATGLRQAYITRFKDTQSLYPDISANGMLIDAAAMNDRLNNREMRKSLGSVRYLVKRGIQAIKFKLSSVKTTAERVSTWNCNNNSRRDFVVRTIMKICNSGWKSLDKDVQKLYLEVSGPIPKVD